MKKLRFHWLEGGSCRHFERSTYARGRWRVVDYSSFFGVLEHPSLGLFLFDTGYSPRFFSATERFPEKLYALATPVSCGEGDTCAAKLEGLGFSPSDVKGIFLSHFHADHMAALHYFPEAKLHFAGEGLRKMQALPRFSQVKNGFLASLVPADVWKRAALLEDARRVSLAPALAPFTDGFDVLGDGSLLAVPLEGHMAGHTGLYFECGAGGVLLVGDAVWHSASIRENSGPLAVARLLIRDWARYQATIARLHELHARHAGGRELHLVPSHCAEFRGKFRGD